MDNDNVTDKDAAILESNKKKIVQIRAKMLEIESLRDSLQCQTLKSNGCKHCILHLNDDCLKYQMYNIEYMTEIEFAEWITSK